MKWKGCAKEGERETHHINPHESFLKQPQQPLTHASSHQHWPKSVEETTKYDNTRKCGDREGGWGFLSGFLEEKYQNAGHCDF